MRRWPVILMVGSLGLAGLVISYAGLRSSDMSRRAAEESARSDAARSIIVADANERLPARSAPAHRAYVPVKARALRAGRPQAPRLTESAAAAVAPAATDVLLALRRQGLPIGGYVTYTAETDENKLLGRPGQYVSKVNFRDKRISAEETVGDPTSIDGGGSIETFTNVSDAVNRTRYVETITQSVGVLAEYDYRVGTVLLRLSHVLTPRQARAYEDALRAVVG